MRPSSAKSKGRRCCAELRDLLLKYAPHLQPDDIVVKPSGVTGEDLYLSPLARKTYPFVFEAKNQERLNIWDALEQAEGYKGQTEHAPLLAFRRNHTQLYVAVSAELFFSLCTKGMGNASQ